MPVPMTRSSQGLESEVGALEDGSGLAVEDEIDAQRAVAGVGLGGPVAACVQEER